MKLQRVDGRIQDGANPIILIGGHYYCFRYDPTTEHYGMAEKGLNIDGKDLPVISTNGAEPCQAKEDKNKIAVTQYWANAWELLNWMKAQGINLLRIFLTNGYERTDLMPYNVIKDPGGDINKDQLDIKNAVLNGAWNHLYFTALNFLAMGANSVGIALQLSVFNFFDFAEEAWNQNKAGKKGFSPWNPEHAYDSVPNSTWNKDNLVVDGGNPATRCYNFMYPKNSGLNNVKKAFIENLVASLQGRPNIIFELMNEPRNPNGNTTDKSSFLSEVAGLILNAAKKYNWRPLLSVNATPDYQGAPPPFDIERWQQSKAPYFDEIDIVSYHGLSGLTANEKACGVENKFFPRVDRDGIVQRKTAHFKKFALGGRDHPDKALMFSTDGVNTYPYIYPNSVQMNLRDGQVRTGFSNETTGVDPAVQRHHSDLSNWAFWCLHEAREHLGYCHFQNHSSYAHSFSSIQEASAKAGGGGGDGQVLTPPFAAKQWTTWQWSNAPSNDFEYETDFDLAQGQITVSLVTLPTTPDAAKAGAVEAGFLHVFTASRDVVEVVADYWPTSIELHRHWALVVASVALRLHAIDGTGTVGALVARVPAVFNSAGAPPGQLRLSASVTRGHQYGLILAADVGIQYEDHNPGRGQIVARYSRVTLSG
ncbi:MAG TPA: hypothetical protein VHQ64_07525 [Pyrinomonadaceae bacterium]|nr:hypothetical protein [Pyrinomonadaceae bacterium]